jgi:hypothetical protein
MVPRPRSLAALSLALAGTCAFGLASAQGPSETAGGWTVTGTWRALASGDDVRAMARDGADLWAATEGGGVVRWSADGTRARQFLAPQDGLPCNDVRDIVRWRGQWWIGTSDGLAVFDAGRERMEPVAASLASPAVTALAVDGAEHLWVASEPWWDPELVLAGKAERGGWVGGGVASSADGRTWQVFGTAQGVPSANVRDVLPVGATIWLATEPYPRWVPPGFDPEGSPVSGRWEPTGGGVGEYNASTWRTYDSTTTTALSENARALAARGDTLWVGTGGRGLVAYRGGKWASLADCGDELRCIQDNFVTALGVSGDGAVWVGTARFNGRGTGVGVLDDGGTPTDDGDDAWHVVRGTDGLLGERVHAILPDPADGSVWFGLAHLDPQGRVQGRGLAHLLSDRQTVVSLSTTAAGGGSLAGNDVTALARDEGTGALWVGTEGLGVSVRRADGGWQTFTRASTAGKLGSDSIADIAIEPGGVVWVATRETTYDTKAAVWADGGLSRFDGTSWTLLRGTEAGLPSNHLSALALDRRGRLWVGTGATDRGPKEHAYRGWGLAVIDTATRRWERTFTYPTLSSNNVTDIVVSGNLVWVATAYFFYVDTRPGGAQVSIGGGVSVYNTDTGQWRKITDQQGLTPSVRARGGAATLLDLRSILVAPDGAIWAGGAAYPNATFVEDVVPDGVVDVIGTDRVTTHRFAQAGAVTGLGADGGGFVWAATRADGAFVKVDDGWLHQRRTRGGLPSSDLSTMSFSGGETWLGTSRHGLVNLVTAPAAPTSEPGVRTPTVTPRASQTVPEATPTPGSAVQRLTEFVFLPSVRRQNVPVFVVVQPGG